MVSSKDVAKLAGVSQTTVSRVLNTPELVHKNTREKVLNAIKELNYQPNSIARSLVKNKTKTISLISGPLHNPFFSESTTSIVNYAKEKGYNVNVYFENSNNNAELYKSVFANKVDGLVLSSIYYEDPIFYKLQKLNIPFVMFNRKHKEDGHYVEMDNVKAGKQATKHLIDLNHRDIVWLGGSLEMSTFKGRFEGYKQTLIENNIPFREENVVIIDTNRQSVFKALDVIMSRETPPTAIHAATDSIAIFVLDYLLGKNFKVPEYISVIGIDNVDFSRHSSFQLSTVSTVSKKNLGRIAIEILLNLLEEENKPHHFIQRTIDTKLIPRKTTGKSRTC